MYTMIGFRKNKVHYHKAKLQPNLLTNRKQQIGENELKLIARPYFLHPMDPKTSTIFRAPNIRFPKPEETFPTLLGCPLILLLDLTFRFLLFRRLVHVALLTLAGRLRHLEIAIVGAGVFGDQLFHRHITCTYIISRILLALVTVIIEIFSMMRHLSK